MSKNKAAEDPIVGCCGPNVNCCCCRVEWAMWANMNALYAAAAIFLGGVIGATVDTISLNEGFDPHKWGAVTRWMAIAIGLFVFFVEYPRSARKNKKTNVERPGQCYVAPFLHITYFLGRNYIFRFLVYLGLIIPCLFMLSTIFGAICLFIACVCYFIAALNGEEWRAPSLAWGPDSQQEEPEQPQNTLPQAPAHPPPRPPPQLQQSQSPTPKYGASISGPPSGPPPRPKRPIDA